MSTVAVGGVVALTWFMEHFEKCSERAVMVKTWLPAQYTGPSTYVDELVYNRALTLVRRLLFLLHPSFSVTWWSHTEQYHVEPNGGEEGAPGSARHAR